MPDPVNTASDIKIPPDRAETVLLDQLSFSRMSVSEPDEFGNAQVLVTYTIGDAAGTTQREKILVIDALPEALLVWTRAIQAVMQREGAL